MKREKQLLLDEMKEQIEKSGSFVLAGYQNMTGDKAYEFRRALAKTGGYFEVVRKRLFVEAARQMGMVFNADDLPGHVGVVLGAHDPLDATKVIVAFSKQNMDLLVLLGGFVDGQKATKDEVTKLASLPGKDQLRAELLGLFVAPMSSVLGTMEAVLGDVVSCIDSKSKQS